MAGRSTQGALPTGALGCDATLHELHIQRAPLVSIASDTQPDRHIAVRVDMRYFGGGESQNRSEVAFGIRDGPRRGVAPRDSVVVEPTELHLRISNRDGRADSVLDQRSAHAGHARGKRVVDARRQLNRGERLRLRRQVKISLQHLARLVRQHARLDRDLPQRGEVLPAPHEQAAGVDGWLSAKSLRNDRDAVRHARQRHAVEQLHCKQRVADICLFHRLPDHEALHHDTVSSAPLSE